MLIPGNIFCPYYILGTDITIQFIINSTKSKYSFLQITDVTYKS